MARHATSNRARVALLCLGFVALAVAAPAFAQEQDQAARDAMPARYEKINAPTDSLGFAVSANDSAGLVPPVVIKAGGLMGVLERSPLGKTGLGVISSRAACSCGGCSPRPSSAWSS